MPTFPNITYDEFRKNATEFFCATQDRSSLTHEQAENGNKALGLLYIGGNAAWTDQEINSAALILELATKRCFEVALVETQQ